IHPSCPAFSTHPTSSVCSSLSAPPNATFSPYTPLFRSVLISADARGMRLGGELMGWAEQSMRDRGHLAFGYLGCREQVVPYYASCGWHRIYACEKSIGRDGESVVDGPGPPILLRPIATLQLSPEGAL